MTMPSMLSSAAASQMSVARHTSNKSAFSSRPSASDGPPTQNRHFGPSLALLCQLLQISGPRRSAPTPWTAPSCQVSLTEAALHPLRSKTGNSGETIPFW